MGASIIRDKEQKGRRIRVIGSDERRGETGGRRL